MNVSSVIHWPKRKLGLIAGVGVLAVALAGCSDGQVSVLGSPANFAPSRI